MAASKEIIEAWIKQIKDAEHLLNEPGHVEITLYANKGKVRRHPTILYHGGPVEFTEPEQVSKG